MKPGLKTLLLLLAGFAPLAADEPSREVRMIDYTDPTYGGRIRQIYNPAGDEHDLYHYRSVF
ncbi:MAG: hypothetical protein U0984_13705, partial [Prosthecobacter sp.]|nr:hypothetical protein [Prosthecobacter sp.]